MKEYVICILVSIITSSIITYVIIPFLRRIKISNTERIEGVKEHLKKAGTPTMGGIAILLSVIITSFIFLKDYPKILPILFVTVSYGAIGFIDDYLKVIYKSSDGLKPIAKLIFQLIIATVFLIYLKYFSNITMELMIPFLKEKIDIGFFAIPLFYICMLGTVNAVNFTDGIDGLASTVTLVVAIFFTVASIVLDVKIFPISLALIGSLLGFLIFNSYPAKIFMGDTGSLALGGFVVSTAYMLNMPIYILIVGGVYLIEIFSVILQVIYFKATKGKRLFKMSPIHHHFELTNWSETRIVCVFGVVAVMLCCIAFLGISNG